MRRKEKQIKNPTVKQKSEHRKLRKLGGWMLDFVFIIVGGICFAASIDIFLEAGKISPGGVSGIATLLHYIFDLPTGIMILALNIPLFILGFIFVNFEFVAKTTVATVVSSVMVDVLPMVVPETFGNDRMLAALYGGVLLGLGIGIIMLRGATTGGTDIVAKLINKRFPSVTMGRGVLILDSFVVAATAIVYRDVESALFTVIALFVSSKVIDTVLCGTENGKIIYVVSEKYQEISDEIISRIGRGVTLLPATGAYTNNQHMMLMCAVRSTQVTKVRRIIKSNDPSAFIMVTDAGQIIGEGFTPENG